MLTTRKHRALRLLMESSPDLAAALAGVRSGTGWPTRSSPASFRFVFRGRVPNRQLPAAVQKVASARARLSVSAISCC